MINTYRKPAFVLCDIMYMLMLILRFIFILITKSIARRDACSSNCQNTVTKLTRNNPLVQSYRSVLTESRRVSNLGIDQSP